MGDLVIIGVTGLPSAGKGLFCDIANDHGFKPLIMGDVIRNECRRRGLPVNRESSNLIMVELRKEKGNNAIALMTLDWIKTSVNRGDKFILIDGIRSLYEVETFVEHYSSFKVVAIHASPSTRLSRAMIRRRKDDAFSKEAFLERDNIELNIGIGDVIAKSDILISSESTLNVTTRVFTEVLLDLLNQKKIEIEV